MQETLKRFEEIPKFSSGDDIPELISELIWDFSWAEKGVKIANVTLHVGIGTFRPVKEETVEAHEMHSEHYYIKQEDVDKINKAKEEGRRVIAVRNNIL